MNSIRIIDCEDSGTLAGNQLRRDLRRWLSPPDPSVNYNAASATQYKGTAAWFIKGSTFADWKASGSLLWVHGKRTPSCPLMVFLTDRLVAGSGKSILRHVTPQLVLVVRKIAYSIGYRAALRSSKMSNVSRTPGWPRWHIFTLISRISESRTSAPC